VIAPSSAHRLCPWPEPDRARLDDNAILATPHSASVNIAFPI
jgi:hypothetical protein